MLFAAISHPATRTQPASLADGPVIKDYRYDRGVSIDRRLEFRRNFIGNPSGDRTPTPNRQSKLLVQSETIFFFFLFYIIEFRRVEPIGLNLDTRQSFSVCKQLQIPLCVGITELNISVYRCLRIEGLISEVGLQWVKRRFYFIFENYGSDLRKSTIFKLLQFRWGVQRYARSHFSAWDFYFHYFPSLKHTGKLKSFFQSTMPVIEACLKTLKRFFGERINDGFEDRGLPFATT